MMMMMMMMVYHNPYITGQYNPLIYPKQLGLVIFLPCEVNGVLEAMPNRWNSEIEVMNAY